MIEKKALVQAYRDLMAQERAVEEQKERIRVDFPAVCRTIFEEDVTALFDAHPDLTTFSWTQYTDFFNDGEPCVFGVQRYDWYINGLDPDDDYDDDDDEEAVKDILDEAELTDERREELEEAVEEFMENYTDDDLEEMFGDHVRVFVGRDGVTTETYDSHG